LLFIYIITTTPYRYCRQCYTRMLYATLRVASRCSLRLLSYCIMSLSYNISYTYTHIISYRITC